MSKLDGLCVCCFVVGFFVVVVVWFFLELVKYDFSHLMTIFWSF